jgi:LPS export ABC transporter protein LptC
MNRLYILALLTAGAIIGATLVAGCSSDDTIGRKSTDIDTLRPSTELTGANIYLYDRHLVTTSIQAALLRKYEDRDSTMGYKLDIDMFDSTGAVVSELVGDSGLIREQTNDLHIYGHVVAVTENGRLETDSLYYNPRTNKIYTDAFVELTRDEDVITGWGLEANRDLTRVTVKRQVSGTITKNPEEQ